MKISFCESDVLKLFLQELIERHAHWNEDIGEWQLKCVAYTGNNMRKSTNATSPGPTVEVRRQYSYEQSVRLPL